jgi:hypothetical protein
MTDNLNFEIHSVGVVAYGFLERGFHSFNDASLWVKNLPYKRNKDKTNPMAVFEDNCGTCSTKHALLKMLADEHTVDTLKLLVGIFKMNGSNTPKVARTLAKNNLAYMPEAHSYLKWHDQILDFTTSASKPSDFESDLLQEIEILPHQIADFKVEYHKQFLSRWLTQLPFQISLPELWAIREQCIADLSVR